MLIPHGGQTSLAVGCPREFQWPGRVHWHPPHLACQCQCHWQRKFFCASDAMVTVDDLGVQAPLLPVLVFLEKQRESLYAFGESKAALQRRFRLCFEEDFSHPEVGDADVVIFYDCGGSSGGTLFVSGGTFGDALSGDRRRTSIVLVNEDQGGAVRQRAERELGSPYRVLSQLPQAPTSSGRGCPRSELEAFAYCQWGSGPLSGFMPVSLRCFRLSVTCYSLTGLLALWGHWRLGRCFCWSR
jgi:hypothetical protein